MRNYLLLFIAALIFLSSCGDQEKTFNKYLSTADSTNFKTNITDPHSPSRKILHTADISYRVQNVLAATTQAERWVKELHGIVTKSEMSNQSVSVTDIPYKEDSLKQTQVYAPIAELVVKVPVENMDSFVNLLSANAQFVAHRTIAQQDVTYVYLANALKNQQKKDHTEPKQYKLPATTPNEILAEKGKTETAQAELAVDRKIENLQMLEDNDYATLTINFAQPEQVETLVKANIVYAVRTPISTQFLLALTTGVTILRNILLVIVQLWPLELIAALGIVVYKRYGKRQLEKI